MLQTVGFCILSPLATFAPRCHRSFLGLADGSSAKYFKKTVASINSLRGFGAPFAALTALAILLSRSAADGDPRPRDRTLWGHIDPSLQLSDSTLPYHGSYFPGGLESGDGVIHPYNTSLASQ